MSLKKIISSREFWYKTFQIGVIFKGLDGILEIIGGGLLLSVGSSTVNRIAMISTRHELGEDPGDFLANYLIAAAHNLSLSAQVFIAFYLLSHGLIKIFLVTSLLKRRLWAYPVAIIFFTAFALYQVYRYNYTHSGWLIFLTIFDILIIVLTWVEYRRIKQEVEAARVI